jgi:transposase
MEGTPFLPLPEGMLVDQVQLTENSLLVTVIATHPTSCCPLCAEASSSIHSSYRRQVRDVSCGGRHVQLALTMRKFFCRNALCRQKIFTERLPQFVEPWARMTIRLCQALQSIGLATSGQGGARLAERLSMQTSRQTILRRIMDLPPIPAGTVVLLGIDDFSFRRGQWFGTILVNLESHRIIDLLPDRRAETVAWWMRLHPDLAVVSRDRGGEYASAAAQAAPQAIQVADRFHVVKNLTEATQLLLAHCQADILTAQHPNEQEQGETDKRVIALHEWRPLEPTHVKQVRLTRRAGRYARYEQVVELSKQGRKPKEIAQQLALGERTVREWLKRGTFPETKKRRVAGRGTLTPLLLLCCNAGRRESAMGSASRVNSQHKGTSDRNARCTATWKRSNRPKYKSRPTRSVPRSLLPIVPSGCLCVTPRRSMRSNEMIWRPFVRPAQCSGRPMASSRSFCQLSIGEKVIG